MTAVSWLEQIIKSMIVNGGDLGEDYPALLAHIQQAKQLEKKQTENDFFGGVHCTGEGWNAEYANGNGPNVETVFKKQFEEYYKETYGSDKSSDEFKTNKLIFVSSPYTNPDEEIRQKNYQDVSEFTADLIEKGHVVFSPILFGHTVSNIKKGMPTDWDFWKNFCLSFLIKCDELIVYQMDGWDRSIGVKEEIEFAEKNGIKILYCPYLN